MPHEPMPSAGVVAVSDRLVRLGRLIDYDDRLSWAPSGASGYQPINCYLLLEPDGTAILIDTGVAIHRDAVLGGIAERLGGRRLSVFLTRSEYECIGNLSAIVESLPIDNLWTGGFTNPFDAFDEITSPYGVWSNRVRLGSIPKGASVPLGDSDRVVVLSPTIRILTTFWAYDRVTRTLFTSDSFTHCVMSRTSDSVVVNDLQESGDIERVRATLLAKFGWLAGATNLRPIIEDLDDVFARFDIEALAPSYGRMLVGKNLVQHHHALLREVLSSLASTSSSRSVMLANGLVEGGQDASPVAKPSHSSIFPREISPGIVWLGKCIEGASVTLRGGAHHSHLSNYIVTGKNACLMVDTGVPSTWQAVSDQLDECLGDRQLDWIFPTHPEYPHSGNLDKLANKYPEARIVGDVRNYHLFFPELEDRIVSVRPQEKLDLGGGYVVEFLPALLRDLPSTMWLWEQSQRVLFVADGFGFFHREPPADAELEMPTHLPGECTLLVSELKVNLEVEQASTIIANALFWSRYTDATDLFDQLKSLMATHPPVIIAPAHGNVIDDIDLVTPLIQAAHDAAYRKP